MGTMNVGTGCLNHDIGPHLIGPFDNIGAELRKDGDMLAWSQEPDGWHANEFRIERAAPHLFVLIDSTVVPSGPVSVATLPLASATTLKGCKREAEVVVAAEARTDLRRKHLSMFLLATAVGVLSVDAVFPTNLIVMIVSTFFAVRSFGIISGTLLWRYAHNSSDVLYQ